MREERFTTLRERLLRGGVARRHARRAVLELREHYADVAAELRVRGATPEEIETQAAERLGSDEAFVSRMLERPELRSFAVRRPFVAFTLLPMVWFFGLFILSAALLIAAFESAARWPGTMPPAIGAALRWLGAAMYVQALWIAPVLAGGASCWMAARQRVPARWAIIGAVVLGVFAASINGHLEAVTASSRGSVGFGIGFSTDLAALAALAGHATVLIAPMLLPYLWWLHRRPQDSRS